MREVLLTLANHSHSRDAGSNRVALRLVSAAGSYRNCVRIKTRRVLIRFDRLELNIPTSEAIAFGSHNKNEAQNEVGGVVRGSWTRVRGRMIRKSFLSRSRLHFEQAFCLGFGRDACCG